MSGSGRWPSGRGGRALAVLLIVAASAAGFTACSKSSKPAICKDRDNLQSSIQDLRNVNVRQDGVTALTDAFDKVKSNAQTLADAAKSLYGPQVDTVKADITALEQAVNTAKSNKTIDTVSAVLTAVSTLVTDSKTLIDDVKNQC
jgi:hypothetical protein